MTRLIGLILISAILAFPTTALGQDKAILVKPGSFLSQPNERITIIEEHRFLITRKQMEKVIVALELQKESQEALAKCRATVPRSTTLKFTVGVALTIVAGVAGLWVGSKI